MSKVGDYIFCISIYTKKCTQSTTSRQLNTLQSGDYLVHHGQTDHHSNHPTNCPPWLQRSYVHDGVEETSVEENLEMEDRSGGFRPNCAVEKCKDHEREAVLQIVAVGFADSFNIVIGNQRSFYLLRIFQSGGILRAAKRVVLESEKSGQRRHKQNFQHEQGPIPNQ